MPVDLERYEALRRIIILLVVLLLAFLMYRLMLWAWNSPAELGSYDMLMRMRPARAPSPNIVILAIDARSAAQLGQLPWSRAVHARIIGALKKAGAAFIVYNLFLDQPDAAHPGADAAFARAVSSAGNVFLPMAYDPLREIGFTPSDIQALIALERNAITQRVVYTRDTWMYKYYYFVPPAAEFATAARGVGVVADVATEGVVRQGPEAYLTTVEYPVPDAPLPISTALPALTGRTVVVPGLPLQVGAALLGTTAANTQVDYTRCVSLLTDTSTSARLPIDRWGRAFTDYAGPAGTFPRYSAGDLLSGALNTAVFAGTTVFVGVTEPAFVQSDMMDTPYGRMPRVEVTANAVNSLITSGNVERRRLDGLAAFLGLAVILGLLLPVLTRWQLGFTAVLAPLLYVVFAVLILMLFRRALPVATVVAFILLSTVIAGLMHPSMYSLPPEDAAVETSEAAA